MKLLVRATTYYVTGAGSIPERSLGRPPLCSFRPPRNETVAHDERIRALVPLELTPFDQAARAALAGEGAE
jgi:hypothetical protein